MRFYRRWQPVAAISFDLDDTLYDNRPTMARAEQWMLAHLRSEYLATAMLDQPRWLRFKHAVLQTNPALHHDVSLTRQLSIQLAMMAGGMSDSSAKREAQRVFARFLAERSRVEVDTPTHRLLAALAERYPLIVITNGNLDLAQAGLAGYFSHVFKAGTNARMKPAPDMFKQAQQVLQLPPEQILHVGDHPRTDVLGARLQGFSAAWLNPLSHSAPEPLLLPDVELVHLEEVAELLL